MNAGLMTTGLTNCSTGGDPAVQSHLCATDAVEGAPNTAAVAETAASEPNVDPNSDPDVDPNSDPNVCPDAEPNSDPNSDSWRVEVAARLARYRTRRKPRTPRYPSLLLPFDSPESWSRLATPSGSTAVAAGPAREGQDFTFRIEEDYGAGGAPTLNEPRETLEQGVEEQGPHRYSEQPANVIEFPRSAAIPVSRPSDLADRVFDLDRPRIVEAPEILPPPPALGGMLMEPTQKEEADRQAGADFPLASASIARRALAALVDGAVLGTSLAAFAAIFLRLNAVPEFLRPLPMLAGAVAVMAVLLWVAYEFLFVVYTGSTPGLRAARLRLAGFDGSPLNRRLRRWRVLASFLSAFSGGLGYLWCVLDQDGLCWHDRITRTHVQSSEHAE
jgi:uncharacterized RDD family membrane protein YckC